MKTYIGVLGLLALSGAVLASPRFINADFDIAGLNQQVQYQKSQLDNHEARIQNLEQNVQSLQQSTGSQPAATVIIVPSVTPAPQTVSTASTVPTAAATISNTAPASIVISDPVNIIPPTPACDLAKQGSCASMSN